MNGHCEEFNFNSHEQQLSSFGKKVLSVLVKKWNRDKIRDGTTPRFRNMPAQSSWATPAPRTHIRKVLNFLSKEAPIQTSNLGLGDTTHFEVPGLEIVDVTHLQRPPMTLENNNNYDISKDPLPHVIHSNELIHTLEVTPGSQNNVTTHDLLKKVNENYLTVDNSAEKALNTKDANIDWQNMFDTELISNISIDKMSTNDNLTVTKPQETNIITPNELIHEKFNKPSETHTKEKQISKKRKAQSNITDAVPKKVKKPTNESKNLFRKHNYTKTVKNWLNDVDLNHPVVGNSPENISDSDQIKNPMIEIVIEKDKAISTKKTVQTHLVNKDGMMKFRKPKHFDSEATAENTSNMEQNINEPKNNVDNTENVTYNKQNTSNSANKKVNENKLSINKEKKPKRKFVTPIKSQIPVKEVNYNIINVNPDDSKNLSCIISSITDSDVLVVLVYSNGFSQLNNHHTEDSCEPAGLLLSIQEQFYYFKGFHQIFKNVLKQVLEKNTLICFDGKSILIQLKSKYDLDTYGFNIIDVKIGACILEPDSSVENFSDLQKVLAYTPEFTVATECNLQKTAWYTITLRECAEKLIRLLTENDLWRVFVTIEMKLLPIIADMEHQGVEVDVTKLNAMEDILLTKMRAVEQQCYKAAGKAFQINSTVQVRTIIYEELKLDAKCNIKIRETIAQGAKSTSEAMLRNLISVHPLPKLILEYRHLHKAHATFLVGIAQHVKDGIVRPTWVQTAAVTGRIASNNPNLQAIPKTPFSLTLFPEGDANDETILFRSVYTCPVGWRVVAADFKHVECRVWANVAADGELLEALSAPDLFRQLAQLWLKKPESEISTEDRERTKRMVYATLYGAGCRKLMDILDLSYENTLAVMASFNSSAADLCKLAMVRSVEQLRASKVDFRLVLQIHDELVFHVRSEQLDQAAVIIKRAMEGCGRECGAGVGGVGLAMSVSLPVQLSVGHNWAQITQYNVSNE